MTFVRNRRGVTLVELLLVVNIVAILVGVGSVFLSEYGDEAKCTEAFSVFPEIIRSQTFYELKHNGYYAALDHDELRARGVDLRDVQYFNYSTFPNAFSSFSIRADATGWAPGGWILFDMKGDPVWSCDGVLVKNEWLPQ